MPPDNEKQARELLQDLWEKNAAEEEPKGTLEVAAPPSTVSAKNIFRHPDAHPYVLDLLLLQRFGPEWLSWEGESLLLLVPESFGQVLSDLNLAKVQAMKTLHLVDTYWKQWEIFLWCTMSLNGGFPNFAVLQVPTVAQCLVSIDIANCVREDVVFGEEVKGFLGGVYWHDGIHLLIPPTPTLSLLSTGSIPESVQKERAAVAEGYLEESRTRLRAQLEMVPHV